MQKCCTFSTKELQGSSRKPIQHINQMHKIFPHHLLIIKHALMNEHERSAHDDDDMTHSPSSLRISDLNRRLSQQKFIVICNLRGSSLPQCNTSNIFTHWTTVGNFSLKFPCQMHLQTPFFSFILLFIWFKYRYKK